MSWRDDIEDLDGFELKLRSVEVDAERALLQAHMLRRHGFRPVEVVGLPSVVWRRRRETFTTAAALREIGVIVPDAGEG